MKKSGGQRRSAKWRAAHPDRAKASTAKWRASLKGAKWHKLERVRYATDPEYRQHILDAARERYATDPEVKRKKREADRTAEKARVRELYATDPEYRRAVQARTQAWMDANPEKAASMQQKIWARRRTRRVGAFIEDVERAGNGTYRDRSARRLGF